MKSKEKEIMIKRVIKNSSLTIYYKECLKEVLKDLEILEIIKLYAKPNLYKDINHCFLEFKINNTKLLYAVPNGYYEIIKEWLKQ